MVSNATVPLPAPDSELGMSPDFENLLLALLDKDPEYRMSWRQLLVHPFWSTARPPTIMPLPAQPQFAAFLQRRPRCVLRGCRERCAVPLPPWLVPPLARQVRRDRSIRCDVCVTQARGGSRCWGPGR